MIKHLTAADIDLLVDCLDYRSRAIQDSPYLDEAKEAREKEYRRRQSQVQAADRLKEKLRRLREAKEEKVATQSSD